MKRGPQAKQPKAICSITPEPPDDLDETALEAWDSVIEDLELEGRLLKTDRKIIELYARTYSVFIKIDSQLAEEPFTSMKDDGRSFINPLLNTRDMYSGRLNAILNSLQLTPKTRGKNKTKPKDDPADKWKGLAGGFQ